jgi:DNA-binding GntR family transcriptional regulator
VRNPLHHKPLREAAADEIRRMIISGEIKGGQRLIEDRLAEQLGVSRNPVREAIRSLEASGLVEVIPRRGAYAVQIDAREVAEIQEVRVVLDAWIVERAARSRSDDDIAELDRCIAEGRAASAVGNSLRASEMHRQFHLALEHASGNAAVSLAMSPLRQRTELVFTVLAADQASISWDEHERLRDAVAAADAALAKKLIVEHINSALDRFTRHVG